MTGSFARHVLPVQVRSVQQLAPTQILSFTARRGVAVKELQIAITGLNDKLVPFWGDSMTQQPHRLSGSVSVDLLLAIESGTSSHRLGIVQEPTPLMTYSAEDSFLFNVSWLSADDSQSGGSFGLLWTSADRALGRSPFILSAQDADIYTRASPITARELSGGLFRRLRRVKQMTRREAWSRRVKKEPMPVEFSEIVRSDSIKVRGLRGFRDEGTSGVP